MNFSPFLFLFIKFVSSFSDSQFLLSWGKLRREPATRWFDWSFAPIPTFDERFARQYRYELPPEFPLASPYAGIVHHLSGPNRCALTQIFHQLMVFSFFFFSSLKKKNPLEKKRRKKKTWHHGSWLVDGALVLTERKKPFPTFLGKKEKKENFFSFFFFFSKVYFHWCVMIFLIITLAHMLDSLVRVTRRVSWDSKMSNHWKENEFIGFPMPNFPRKEN